MAVTWKKVLGSGQVLSGDLATEGSSGQFLTTNGSGALSYTSGTGAHGCPDTSGSPTFTGTVQGATLKATTKVETDSVQAPQSSDLELGSDYQSNQVVDVNGVKFYGSATPAVQASRNIGAGTITCSVVQMADNGRLDIGTGDDMKLYHDATNSYITNATGALKIATETSGIAVTIGHTTSLVTIGDNLTATGDITGDNLITGGDVTASSGAVSCGTLTVGQDATVSGNLTVSGDTITQNVSSILVEDDAITMLHNVANDTTDGAIVFMMDTASAVRAIGHDASDNRLVVATGITDGVLAGQQGFVNTVETHSTDAPTSSDLGSGVGSIWIEEDANYMYIRVE